MMALTTVFLGKAIVAKDETGQSDHANQMLICDESSPLTF